MRYLIGAAIGVGMIASAFIGLGHAHAAEAQLVCVPEGVAMDAARSQGQHPVAAGSLTVGGAMLVTAGDDGTWALWVARVPGQLCPVMNGTAWEAAKPETPS